MFQGPEDHSLISGMPEEHTLERTVRIYKPAKNAMQSGTAGIKRYIFKTFLELLKTFLAFTTNGIKTLELSSAVIRYTYS